MKRLVVLGLIAAIAVCAGCSKSKPEVKKLDPELQPYKDAFDTIATSSDQKTVGEAVEKIEKGGVKALKLLCMHLDDDRIPKTKAIENTARGQADMGMHAYWLIQRIVEEPGPDFYSSAYGAFSMSTVEAWLADRFEKPLKEIKLDAAKASLAIAEKELKDEPNKFSQPAVDRFKKIIEQLQTQSSSSSGDKKKSEDKKTESKSG